LLAIFAAVSVKKVEYGVHIGHLFDEIVLQAN
jgi:hypothetical protein